MAPKNRHWNSQGQRAYFERIVSSFLAREPDGETGQAFGFGGTSKGMDELYNSFGPAKTEQTWGSDPDAYPPSCGVRGNAFGTYGQGSGRLDQFFYWNEYPYGVPFVANQHFRNRGIISFGNASAHALHRDFEPGVDDGARWRPNWSTPTQKDRSYSTIGLFSGAREYNFGKFLVDTTDVDGKYSPVEDFPPHDQEFLGNGTHNDPNKHILYYMDNRGFEHFSDVGNSELPDGSKPEGWWEMSKNRDWGIQLYNWIKDIIAGAPYDHWFDIHLGVRLNMIIPLMDDSKFDDIKTMLETIQTTQTKSDSIGHVDEKYIMDKAFLLSAPKYHSGNSAAKGMPYNRSEDNNQWLCIPLEFYEEDLLDYWKKIYNDYSDKIDAHGGLQGLSSGGWPSLYSHSKMGGTFTMGTQSLVKGFLTPVEEIESTAWHPLMEGITELGKDTSMEKYGMYYKFMYGPYVWPAAGDINERNSGIFWHNMHIPEERDNLEVVQQLMASQFNSVATGTDFERPNLFAACKLINVGLNKKTVTKVVKPAPDDSGAHALKDLRYEDNPTRQKVIERLKNKLLDKMKNNGNVLLEEVLPLKESVMSAVFIYRYIMQLSYPAVDHLFKPTKEMINALSVQTIKAVEGDYQYLPDSVLDSDPGKNAMSSSPSPTDISHMFLKLVVQMAANTMDPTWKTPWFFPGPLTPVGVLAKIMAKKSGSADKNPEDIKEDSIGGKPCEDPPGDDVLE